MRGCLVLLFLGYALQLPGGSLAAALRAGGEQLAVVCRVGPLQLVALTLGLAQLALAVVSTPRRHALLSVASGLVVMLGATRVVRSELSECIGPSLGAFVTDGGGSHFPIFAWAAFVLFGIGCAGLRHERPGALPAGCVVGAGALLAAGAQLVYQDAAIQNDTSWWWRTSASYLLFRLGLVVLLVGVLHGRRDDEPTSEAGGPSV